jgi:hypothetical protein
MHESSIMHACMKNQCLPSFRHSITEKHLWEVWLFVSICQSATKWATKTSATKSVQLSVLLHERHVPTHVHVFDYSLRPPAPLPQLWPLPACLALQDAMLEIPIGSDKDAASGEVK